MAQIYSDNVSALVEVDNRQLQMIGYECPFYSSRKACGNWCSLFEIAEHTRGADGAVIKRVNLRCGDGNRIFMTIA